MKISRRIDIVTRYSIDNIDIDITSSRRYGFAYVICIWMIFFRTYSVCWVQLSSMVPFTSSRVRRVPNKLPLLSVPKERERKREIVSRGKSILSSLRLFQRYITIMVINNGCMDEWNAYREPTERCWNSW